jgi:hypothetical protein
MASMIKTCEAADYSRFCSKNGRNGDNHAIEVGQYHGALAFCSGA